MPFLKDCWYVLGFAKEFTGQPIRRQIIGEYLAIFREASGVLNAVEDRCPHRFVPLSLGRVEGGQIRCGYHGLAFDGETGACTDRPMGDGAISPKLRVKAYAVEERYDIAWAWMGDRDEADPTLIPDFSLVSDPGLHTITGYLKIEGHVQLVVDNLLDLSHVQFLHPEIASSGDLSKFQCHVEQDGATVWQRLFRPNVEPNSFQKMMWTFAGETVDSIGDVRWNAPGLILAFASWGDVGTPPEAGLRLPSAHLLTPETEHSTHYFWASGRNAEFDNPALDALLEKTLNTVFITQDGWMIEAQQREMGQSTDFLSMNPVILKSDAAGIRARRVMNRLLVMERQRQRVTESADA